MDFLKVPATDAQISFGTVKLPILYADGASLLAFFWVDRARAAPQLAGTGLEPAHFPGGRTLYGLAFYDYRKTSIGPYHEVGSALAVQREGETASAFDLFRPPSGRRLGFHILDLPVSTAIADAAGRELWGYPKFVTEIPERFAPGEFSGAVMAPDGSGEILRLEGRAHWIVPVPSVDLLLYSHLGGQMLRTAADVKAPTRIAGGGTFRLTLGTSHRMAESMRALGLEGARPFAVARCDAGFQCRLHAGVPVSAAADAPRGTRRASPGSRTGTESQAHP